jgi:moderate conductance mechanosensitive channel
MEPSTTSPTARSPQVANRSKGWARAVVDVPVDYRVEPARVRPVLERVAQEAKTEAELGRKLYTVPKVLGVENLGDFKVVWRVTADTKPGRQFDVMRALQERIHVAFEKEGIETPAMVLAGPGRSSSQDGTR